MPPLTPKPTSHRTWLLGFLIANAILKFPLLPLNTGEYTDGILQLEVFTIKSGLYPPLYGGFAWFLQFLSINPETAGRLVSIIASILTVIPVYFLGRIFAGKNAAIYAALLFTLSPLALRWTPRVMTDSLFLLLCTSSMYYAVVATRALDFRGGIRARRHLIRGLSLASLFAALATLTRHQGILIVPLLAVVTLMFLRRYKRLPLSLLLTALPWLLVPAWMYIGGFVHTQQFTDRTAQDLPTTLLAYWNNFESFVLISPYYFGYPVMALAVFGMTRGTRAHSNRTLWFHLPWIALTIMLLGLQSMFGSFQYRYMMPALPYFLVLAGSGLATLERNAISVPSRARRYIFKTSLYGTVIFCLLFAMAILLLQRQAFQDQKESARWIAENLPQDTRVFSNEQYGSFNSLGPVKMQFWLGRKAHMLSDPSRPDGIAQLVPGDLVALGSYYSGEGSIAPAYEALSTRYRLQPIGPHFESTLTPLMDDIMARGLYNQNPTGWVMRYTHQNFYTRLFRIEQALIPAGLQ